MFCCTLLYVYSSIVIILMGKRELIALFNLSSWCLVMVERLFLAVPQGCLQFVIVVFPDHTHLLFLLNGAGSEDGCFLFFILYAPLQHNHSECYHQSQLKQNRRCKKLSESSITMHTASEVCCIHDASNSF